MTFRDRYFEALGLAPAAKDHQERCTAALNALGGGA